MIEIEMEIETQSNVGMLKVRKGQNKWTQTVDFLDAKMANFNVLYSQNDAKKKDAKGFDEMWNQM